MLLHAAPKVVLVLACMLACGIGRCVEVRGEGMDAYACGAQVQHRS